MNQREIPILMYHQVGDFRPMKTHRPTYCHYRRFNRQMAWLKHFGYDVISLGDALLALKGDRTMPARPVVLTFDDGYQNFYEYAYPTLQKYGFPSTVYLLSDLIGDRAQWLLSDGHEAPQLMDAATVRSLAQHNVEFGSHGKGHVRLSTVSPETLQDEVSGSKSALEGIIDRPVSHFCYPYGDYNSDVARAVQDAGFVSAVTCVKARANAIDSLFELPRLAVSFGMSLAGFVYKMHIK